MKLECKYAVRNGKGGMLGTEHLRLSVKRLDVALL